MSAPRPAAGTAGPALDGLAAAVAAAVAAVPDPELPPVTIGMLGMIHQVAVGEDGRVTVELLPTFSGCPATEMIARDVEAAVATVAGVAAVDVRFRFDPPWSTDRITPEGRERLRGFGIAPPPGRGALPTLPTLSTPCPYCRSEATVRESPFGPTPCRAIHHCAACRQPFEAFKPL